MKGYHHLSKKERRNICDLLWQGYKVKTIAYILSRPPSTIYREIKRNTNPKYKRYYEDSANSYYLSRRALNAKLNKNKSLQEFVFNCLAKKSWSPEQISGRLKLLCTREYVCCSTIYRYLKTNFKRSLLPRKGKKYRYRIGNNSEWLYGKIISIHDRPEIVNTRERFGDWEADLVVSPKGSKANITTMIERKSRYLMAIKNEGKSSAYVFRGLKTLSKSIPCRAKHTLTLDRGHEFTVPDWIKKKCKIDAYYCDKSKPWQKGAVENINKRIRRFFPKKTDFNEISQQYLNKIVCTMNNTPRKCLNFLTPYEVFKRELNNHVALQSQSTSSASRQNCQPRCI